MEKWIGPMQSKTIFEWLILERQGVLSADHRGSYRKDLSRQETQQLLYWGLRGVCPFQLMCWASDAVQLQEKLGTNREARLALIGDVSAYKYLAGFILGEKVRYHNRVLSFSMLSEPRRQLMADAELRVTWVRPLPEDVFPLYPVVL